MIEGRSGVVSNGHIWSALVSLGHFDCHTVSMNSGRRFLRAEFEKDLANGELFLGLGLSIYLGTQIH